MPVGVPGSPTRSPMKSSPSRSPTRQGPRDYQAGPVCGGAILRPKEDYTVKEIQVPTSMQRTLIFVVDLSDAVLMDPELKPLEDLRSDVLDAMGVASGKREFQVILAGYEGHERLEITDTAALKSFFERMEVRDQKSYESDADLYGDDPEGNGDPARIAALKDYASYKKAATAEFAATKQQLAELRLGSIITKMQMRRYIDRLLEIQKDSLQANFERDTFKHLVAETDKKVEAVKQKLQEQQDLYFELESSIEKKVVSSIADARVVFEQDKQREMQKQREDLTEKFNKERDTILADAERKLQTCTAPLQARIAELDANLLKQEDKLKAADAQILEAKNSLETTLKELEATKTEKAIVEAKLRALEGELGAARASLKSLQEKLDKEVGDAKEKAAAAESAAAAKLAAAEEKKKREEERREREAAAAKAAEERRKAEEEAETSSSGRQAEELAKLKEDMEGLAKSLDEAYKIFDDYGIPIPGRTTQDHDARTFKWKITKLEEKIEEYAKDRPCMSQEFTLWGLKGLQVEWYPNGVDNSFPGWSAVKLRIPTMQSRCKVAVKWRVIFGSNLWVGPRSDEFCEQYWWCRKGVINWPNFCKTEILKQQVDEKGAITMTIDIIKATITPVDDRGITLAGLPKRMPQVLATQSAAQMHSIALGGGFNSIQGKGDVTDVDIELVICGERFDDPQLINLIKRYIKQTHLAIENNPHGVSSKNAESPRYNGSPCTLRPRTQQTSKFAQSPTSRPGTVGFGQTGSNPSSPMRPGTSAGLVLPSMTANLGGMNSMMSSTGGLQGSPSAQGFFSPMNGNETAFASSTAARKRGLPMSPSRSPKRM
ncbi:unnamed protein product [Amoebophrya sp. A25]|nr:unnamed protein product [Amoebophrya sp. A25]|eukprot:GSA25T00022605001.1